MTDTTTKLAILSVLFTSNNVLFTLTRLDGSVIFWTSSGSKKVKKTKKVTLTTLTLAIKTIIKCVNDHGYDYLYIKIKGFNKNKKIILKYFKNSFLNISLISDEICFPHNGCRRVKKRRI